MAFLRSYCLLLQIMWLCAFNKNVFFCGGEGNKKYFYIKFISQ